MLRRRTALKRSRLLSSLPSSKALEVFLTLFPSPSSRRPRRAKCRNPRPPSWVPLISRHPFLSFSCSNSTNIQQPTSKSPTANWTCSVVKSLASPSTTPSFRCSSARRGPVGVSWTCLRLPRTMQFATSTLTHRNSLSVSPYTRLSPPQFVSYQPQCSSGMGG